MSNQQNNPSKSPYRYQSNKGLPNNNQSGPNSCVPTNHAASDDRPAPIPATRAAQKEKPPAQNTPTKNRSAVPTPRQSQGNKQPAQDTPTNSLACVPRERSTKMPSKPNPTQRPPLNKDKTSPLFNPAVSSTPKSSPIRVPPSPSTPLKTAPETTQPQSSPHSPEHQLPTAAEVGRQFCVCPLPPGSIACVPRNASNFTECCVPAELVDRTPTRPQVVRGERILKLEILAISGGTLYDLDKIHEQSLSCRSTTPSKVEPSYDPRFDIDRMEASKPAKEVSEGDSDVKTLLSEERRRGGKAGKGEHDADTLEPRSFDDESTLVRDALSRSESNITHDSSLTGPPGAPKKRTSAESDDDHGVMLSAPDVPDTFNVSDFSLTDAPPAKEEEKAAEMATVAPLADGEQLSLGNDDVAMGDVSIPRLGSDISDLDGTDGEDGGAKRRKRDADAQDTEKADDSREKEDETDPKRRGEADDSREKEDETDPKRRGEADTEGAVGELDSKAGKEREPVTDEEATIKVGGDTISDDKRRIGDEEADKVETMDRGGEADRRMDREVNEDDARRGEKTEVDRREGPGESPDKGSQARKEDADTKTGVESKPEEKGEREERGADRDREADRERDAVKDTEADRDRKEDGDRGKKRDKEADRDGGADTERESDRDRGADRGKEADRDREADRADTTIGVDLNSDARGREADGAKDADRRLGAIVKPDEGSTEAADKKGIDTGAGKREDDTRPPKKDDREAGGKADTKRDARPLSGIQDVDRPDGVGSESTPGLSGGTAPAESREAQAGQITDDGRGSISLIFGPSVRNFAHLALSPLTSLRTFLGPAPNSRPSRRKRVRHTVHPGHPEYVRMRSIRSAFLVTPYQAAATSFGQFLPRQNQRRGRKSGSTESESSSED